MKHTPGPWAREGFAVYKLNDEGINRMCINVMQHVNRMPIDEQLANAQLIAAAPEMHEALKDVACESKHWSQWKNTMDDFIEEGSQCQEQET